MRTHPNLANNRLQAIRNRFSQIGSIHRGRHDTNYNSSLTAMYEVQEVMIESLHCTQFQHEVEFVCKKYNTLINFLLRDKVLKNEYRFKN